MTQTELDFDKPISPVDPNLHPEDEQRVTGQNRLILERLLQGPATSTELQAICRRYSARAHDLRKAGYRISSRRLAGAEWLFSLEETQ